MLKEGRATEHLRRDKIRGPKHTGGRKRGWHGTLGMKERATWGGKGTSGDSVRRDSKELTGGSKGRKKKSDQEGNERGEKVTREQ